MGTNNKGRVPGSKNKSPKIAGRQLNSIVKRYLAGESTKDIGADLGFSDGTIARYLKSAGVQLRRPGFQVGEGHHAWKGGRIINPFGYAMVRVQPDHPFFCMAVRKADGASYVLEHRLVVAERLGRPLEEHETVHHIDGDKLNNSDDNLQLRVGRHGKGAAFRCLDCGSCNIEAVSLGEPSLN